MAFAAVGVRLAESESLCATVMVSSTRVWNFKLFFKCGLIGCLSEGEMGMPVVELLEGRWWCHRDLVIVLLSNDSLGG